MWEQQLDSIPGERALALLIAMDTTEGGGTLDCALIDRTVKCTCGGLLNSSKVLTKPPFQRLLGPIQDIYHTLIFGDSEALIW